MKPTLVNFFAAHVEWLGLKPGLKPTERRSFARWLIRSHPELVGPYRSEPALFRLTCQEVQRGGRLPTPSGIGEAILRRHAEALSRRFLSLPLAKRGTFQDFLNDILRQHPNERALKRFLASEPSKETSD